MEEFLAFFSVKANSEPEVDSDCTGDKEFIRWWRRWVLALFKGVFRTPSGWTSSTRLAAPTVVGRRGLPCCAAVSLGTDRHIVVNVTSAPPPPPPPPPSRLRQVDAFVDFSCLVVVDMLVHGEHAATGSAMRRRQRRLRQWRRHER